MRSTVLPPRLPGGNPPPAPAPAAWQVTIHAARRLPRLAVRVGGRLRRSSLGELIHQRWLNMILEYPDVGFGWHQVHPDRVEMVLHLPRARDPEAVLRGLLAHFKAAVTRDAPAERPVWEPGYSLAVAASGNGTSRVSPSRAMTVSGKIAAASARSSGASRE